jgi:hypothetical protein
MRANYDSIDESYSIFARTGPEYGGGLSNHGPMASEALCAMGHPEAVGEWVHRYQKRLEAHPAALMRISEHDWRENLGKSNRVGDWIALFDEALKEAPWQAVLDRWVARLAPGIAAAAFHGVLRTAHAVRSLGERESAQRIHELAEGLGYWAATYQPLPRGGGGSRDKLPSRAIESVKRIPLERRVAGAFLTDGLAGLEGFEPFGGVLEMIDTSGDTSSLVSNLTETFARIYAKNAIGIGGAIAFIHCVTGPRAVRNMSPHLSDPTVREAVRYAWQAAAGLYAAFAIEGPSSDEPAISDLNAETLIHRAIESGDEHAIKFTEACIGEYALNPKPVYFAAAAHAIQILPPLK